MSRDIVSIRYVERVFLLPELPIVAAGCLLLIFVPVLACADFCRGLRLPNINLPTLDIIFIIMIKGNKTKNKTGRKTYNATIVPTVKKNRHNVNRIKNEPKKDQKRDRRLCKKKVNRTTKSMNSLNYVTYQHIRILVSPYSNAFQTMHA